MKRYFKICLWSPIWFPVLLLLTYLLGEAVCGNFIDLLPEWIEASGFIIVYSVILGGLQYLMTVVFLWGLIDFNEFTSWLKWVLLLPLVFTVFQVFSMLLIFVWEFDRISDFAVLGVLGLFDLGLGYAYVAIWLIGYAVIRMFEKIERGGTTV
ncbi:MAG: hypothetical protein CML13_19040 [Puniceicoccaceae bacterium]|nr:hypothetical protein [Puniceicoccaceae bacterium]|tara:strand:- start:22120 stop:22578 length:459 start_codon:yes stop_codon:yes gene_type:complete